MRQWQLNELKMHRGTYGLCYCVCVDTMERIMKSWITPHLFGIQLTGGEWVGVDGLVGVLRCVYVCACMCAYV